MKQKASKTGVLGGSFDPVHVAHLIVGECVRSALALDKVLFVPANRPPHKGGRSLTEPHHRLAMLRLALRDAPDMEVCDVELRRGGVSYTVDTLEQLRRESAEPQQLYLIVGADMVADLPNWKDVGRLPTLCDIVPVERGGLPSLIGDDRRLDSLRQILGRESVERMRTLLVRAPRLDVSSTEIRRRLAAGESVRFLVPPEVDDYIREHGLYGI